MFTIITKRTFKQWQNIICQRDNMRFENDRNEHTKTLNVSCRS